MAFSTLPSIAHDHTVHSLLWLDLVTVRLISRRTQCPPLRRQLFAQMFSEFLFLRISPPPDGQIFGARTNQFLKLVPPHGRSLIIRISSPSSITISNNASRRAATSPSSVPKDTRTTQQWLGGVHPFLPAGKVLHETRPCSSGFFQLLVSSSRAGRPIWPDLKER